MNKGECICFSFNAFIAKVCFCFAQMRNEMLSIRLRFSKHREKQIRPLNFQKLFSHARIPINTKNCFTGLSSIRGIRVELHTAPLRAEKQINKHAVYI